MGQIVTALDVVQRQFEAYNERNVERFVANFSDSFKAYRIPSMEPAIVGKRALADFYATERFNRPGLKAELITRTVMGNKVFDYERIWGLKEHAVETVAVFEVGDGLIDTAWFFSPG